LIGFLDLDEQTSFEHASVYNEDSDPLDNFRRGSMSQSMEKSANIPDDSRTGRVDVMTPPRESGFRAGTSAGQRARFTDQSMACDSGQRATDSTTDGRKSPLRRTHRGGQVGEKGRSPVRRKRGRELFALLGHTTLIVALGRERTVLASLI
jgi:hypothetical protein